MADKSVPFVFYLGEETVFEKISSASRYVNAVFINWRRWCMKSQNRGWGDGSVTKVLVEEAWEPEFDPQHSDTVVYFYKIQS